MNIRSIIFPNRKSKPVCKCAHPNKKSIPAFVSPKSNAGLPSVKEPPLILVGFDTTPFVVVSRDKEFLQSISPNCDIISVIQNTLSTYQFTSDHNLNEIKADLDDVIETIRQRHFVNSTDSRIYKGIHCVVHNFIWNALMPLIRAAATEEDTRLYEKSKKFCRFRRTWNEDVNSLSIIPFTSAIVELSLIDVYKSPLEMLGCLCTTYDLIHAELKAGLVPVISKDSDEDLEIPVVNNDEVIFLISKVLIKSQLLHFCSNMFYIKMFGEKILEENHDMRTIIHAFEMAERYFLGLDDRIVYSALSQKGINACEMMEILSEEESPAGRKNSTLEGEKKRRLISLIKTSTGEKDSVPIEAPKLFS